MWEALAHDVAYDEVHWLTAQRIRRARETLEIIERVIREPTRENIVALHELHASHLRELGDQDGADRAEFRAAQTRRRTV